MAECCQRLTGDLLVESRQFGRFHARLALSDVDDIAADRHDLVDIAARHHPSRRRNLLLDAANHQIEPRLIDAKRLINEPSIDLGHH